MAKAPREILLTDVQDMARLDELAIGARTDAWGLTLGDLGAHRRSRFLTLYRVLHLGAGMARIGLIDRHDLLEPVGAKVQDKTGIDTFQAAHVLPCDFKLNGKPGLHQLFESPIIRGNVKLNLFGRTTMVHRLVNYADRRCEALGWIDAFRDALLHVIGGAAADGVYSGELLGAYAAAVAKARGQLLAELDALERRAMATPALLAPNGLPARPREQDFRVGKRADARVRGINKAAVLQVFDDYRLGAAELAPTQFDGARQEVSGWVELERQWRARHR